MRRLLLPAAALVVVACCTAFAYVGRGSSDAFRLPDASAACRLDGDGVVCRSLAVPEGIALGTRGAPRAVDAPVWWDASTPVLHRFDRDGIACRVSGAAILCRNEGGTTIAVGPRHVAAAL